MSEGQALYLHLEDKIYYYRGCDERYILMQTSEEMQMIVFCVLFCHNNVCMNVQGYLDIFGKY